LVPCLRHRFHRDPGSGVNGDRIYLHGDHHQIYGFLGDGYLLGFGG
jgi:hypothetical protein